ncbi:hypothetical protein HFO27_13420 [Rhizobium leguminosarum]|uniref:hypothetical protein n=1 Tax=Rhizobium leguminosarum TaxID=384 RepID=UPI001C8FC82B|nr:hypothetical protein [Rhizobium leguminosarum]MBY3175632.1 hypothetical protein [Rhizobium leguminosarum]
MAGGGYAKTWRHYVNAANFADAGSYESSILTDLENMQHQIDLDQPMRQAVDCASRAVLRYLSSFGPFKRDGDETRKDEALKAIDDMEASLVGATGRYD